MAGRSRTGRAQRRRCLPLCPYGADRHGKAQRLFERVAVPTGLGCGLVAPRRPLVRASRLWVADALPEASSASEGSPVPLLGRTAVAVTAHTLGNTAVAQGLWPLACWGSKGQRGERRDGDDDTDELEARLLAVETALKALERRLATLSPTPNWLDEITGSFKEEPAFDEVITFGRAFRDTDAPVYL